MVVLNPCVLPLIELITRTTRFIKAGHKNNG